MFTCRRVIYATHEQMIRQRVDLWHQLSPAERTKPVTPSHALHFDALVNSPRSPLPSAKLFTHSESSVLCSEASDLKFAVGHRSLDDLCSSVEESFDVNCIDLTNRYSIRGIGDRQHPKFFAELAALADKETGVLRQPDGGVYIVLCFDFKKLCAWAEYISEENPSCNSPVIRK